MKTLVVRCFAPAAFAVALSLLVGSPQRAAAQRFVPGTGQKLDRVCDDFEDENWSYRFNAPKASHELDKQARTPNGFSANGKWQECFLRGQPDVVKRVEPPAGGIPGSTGALLLQSLRTGIPGQITNQPQQDDLQMNVSQILRGSVPVQWRPSATVRVFVPPFEQWENRSGSQFGFRADARGMGPAKSKGLFSFSSGSEEVKEYWPGMFIEFHSETDPRFKKDSACLTVRAGPTGGDLKGPDVTPGWWTLGLSFTPDGRIHYYAHKGVEDLTDADFITSQAPYGYRCTQINTIFFNVANMDNGQSWTTPWVIDDPKFFWWK